MVVTRGRSGSGPQAIPSGTGRAPSGTTRQVSGPALPPRSFAPDTLTTPARHVRVAS